VARTQFTNTGVVVTLRFAGPGGFPARLPFAPDLELASTDAGPSFAGAAALTLPGTAGLSSRLAFVELRRDGAPNLARPGAPAPAGLRDGDAAAA